MVQLTTLQAILLVPLTTMEMLINIKRIATHLRLLLSSDQIGQLYVNSLPPSISHSALSFFDEFIKLQQELLNLHKRKDKLSDPNYNFKSGHVNFTLTCTNCIKDDEAFMMKSTECKEKIHKLQSFLQLNCIEVVDLEIEAVNQQLCDRFCYWLYILSMAICKYDIKSEDKGIWLAVLLISWLHDSASSWQHSWWIAYQYFD
jgi:hypothetical protein